MFSSITKESLTAIVASSRSKREILQKLGVNDAGSMYPRLNALAKQLGVELPTYDSKKYIGGRTGSLKTIEDLFQYNSGAARHTLKKAMIEHFGIIYECQICKLTEWLGKPLTLDLDHIDGDNLNNILTNLRFLCPNCHQQQPTTNRKKI